MDTLHRIKRLLYVNMFIVKRFGIDILLYVNLYRAKVFGTDICLGQTSVWKKNYLAKLFYFCIYLAANNFIRVPMTQGFQICN